MITPLREFQRGKVITADDLNAVVRQLRAFTPQSSATVKADVQPGGTTFTAVGVPTVDNSIYPDFFVYQSDDTQISITGGTMQLLSSGTSIQVDDDSDIDVADGDKVWLQQDSGTDWSFDTGSEWPDDKFVIALVSNIKVETEDDTDKITEISYEWTGGDIILPEFFPVQVEKDGGSLGDGEANTDCDASYKIKTLDDIELETELTPETPRHPGVEYEEADTGIAYLDGDANWCLLWCNERPKFSIAWDSTNHKLMFYGGEYLAGGVNGGREVQFYGCSGSGGGSEG